MDPPTNQPGASSAMPARRQIGPYQVTAKLGAGGMGEVYRAHDPKLGRDVALKILPAAVTHESHALARLEREARTLASLNHPNIAAIYGLEESDGLRALVMELVEGETLTERIRGAADRKPLPLEEALTIATQIAEAMEYAHERGVIHRDLKPANVKITSEGTVKVLDFGLAKVVSGEDSTAPVSANSPTLSVMATQAGIILGTAAYMAPEQAKGKQVDRRADIWAFGCVLFEMFTGKRAFDGETISDVLAAVIKSEPDWTALPQTTPPTIVRLVRRCLQKDLRQRLQAIGDARIAIEETSSGTDTEGALVVSGAAESMRASLLHRTLPWALGATAILFAAIAAWFALRPQPEPILTRFSIVPPNDTELYSAGDMSISPDGRTLAFIAKPDLSKPQGLWLRPLDSLAAQPVPGTDGAYGPFWSPDSRQIGFRANGKLEKVGLSGSAPEVLCDASGSGASWSRDGVILFNDQSSLYRVPDTGGAPTLVLTPDSSQATSSFRFPQFLPDGRHFIVAEVSASGSVFTVAGSLDAKSVERLGPAESQANYVPPGYLLYTSQSTLMARPFDARALRFTGPAVPVAQSVGWAPYLDYSYFAVSPAGVLAYRTSPFITTIQMTWFNRAGEKLGTVGPPGMYTGPALSPDGTKLGAGVGEFGKRNIWIYDLKRGSASRLTFDSADDTNTTWSPDGTKILFSSNRDGLFDLYQQAANGLSSTEPLFQSKLHGKHIDDVTADGRYLIYDTAAATGGNNTQLWILPLVGERKPYAFVEGSFGARSAAFSPNGHFVAYTSNETGSLEVYVQTFPQQAGKWQVSTSGGNDPVWSHDGKELFYLGLDGRLMMVDVDTGTATLQAGIPKPLFQTELNGAYTGRNQYVVSPDGQRFLMLVPAGQAAASPITVVVNWPAVLDQSGGR